MYVSPAAAVAYDARERVVQSSRIVAVRKVTDKQALEAAVNFGSLYRATEEDEIVDAYTLAERFFVTGGPEGLGEDVTLA